MTTTAVLLPCPFCNEGTYHKPDCWFELKEIGASKSRLMEAWNRRAANAKPDQVDATAQDFVLVPKEPTKEMLDAAFKAIVEYQRTNAPLHLDRGDGIRTAIYQSMLAAVPQPAQAQQPIADEREALDDALDADAMLELRNRVLEEAAKACEATRYTYTKYNDEVEYNRACDESAAAIRSLQSPQSEVREQAPEKVGRQG